MMLVVLTIVVIALLIDVLAIFLFRIGVLLNRTADELEACVEHVKKHVAAELDGSSAGGRLSTRPP